MAGLPLQLVVGLGNPGPEHEDTRHNAGFWFVDELARRHDGHLRPERRYNADAGRVTIAGAALWLLKPMGYMNRSGLSVRSFCDYLQLAADQVLVVHDELDLPAGVARLKSGGGAGGHNGLKDIAAVMACPIGTVRSRIFRAREAISARVRPLLDRQTGKRW